jgi:hypothetical protein
MEMSKLGAKPFVGKSIARRRDSRHWRSLQRKGVVEDKLTFFPFCLQIFRSSRYAGNVGLKQQKGLDEGKFPALSIQTAQWEQ